jgi:hypothetical protein
MINLMVFTQLAYQMFCKNHNITYIYNLYDLYGDHRNPWR